MAGRLVSPVSTVTTFTAAASITTHFMVTEITAGGVTASIPGSALD